MTGTVDYLCNAFAPRYADEWDAAIARQGVPVKVRRDPDDGFCEPDVMVKRMDELGIDTMLVVTGDPQDHPGARTKTVFGTNFPTVGHRHALAQVAELDLAPKTRDALLGGTARRVFTRLP